MIEIIDTIKGEKMETSVLTTRNFLELSGKLIYLKRLDTDYIDEYWECLSQSCIESNILTGTTQVFNKTNVMNFIEDIITDRSRIDFLALSKETNKIIGEVVLNDIDRNNRNASIRVAINKNEDFGKGYGSEALILALNYGYGMLNLHRVELEVIKFNERAIHVYEKIGFKREGVKRQVGYFNHHYYDLIIMSMLEDEFRTKYININDSIEDLIKS